MHHWVPVVAEEEAGPKGLRWSIQLLVLYFYYNDYLIDLTRAGLLQQVFGTLMDLFDHVSLRTNVRKMTSIVFQLYHSPGGIPVKAYT